MYCRLGKMKQVITPIQGDSPHMIGDKDEYSYHCIAIVMIDLGEKIQISAVHIKYNTNINTSSRLSHVK